MRTAPQALLLALFLLVNLALLAQQPAKTKTPRKDSRNNSDTARLRTDTTKMQTDTTGSTTTLQGGGGGTGAAAPYTAMYSSQFTMGNPEHARMVLNFWKDFDDNTLDRSAGILSDTVMLQVHDGRIIRGKDSLMRFLKQIRGQYTAVKSTVDAYMPLRSTDRNQDLVLIWGVEDDTTASGTTTVSIHEIWRINRDGKIDYVSQYIATPPVR